MTVKRGRHFLQIPGPTNVPDRILRAIDRPTIDHRGPEFGQLGRSVLEGLKPVFRCSGPVLVFPGSGTGAWEAAMVNTLSPGDRVVMFETGQFAVLWRDMAERLGLDVDWVEGDWRHGIDADTLSRLLAADRGGAIKAVCAVHNDTSTGITSDIAALRAALDRAGHPALLMTDVVSSLAAIDYRHDEWGVDVTVAGSQKGLMLPPGLGFTAISEKALAATETARLPRAYWDWKAQLGLSAQGYFPYTPNTNLLYGLVETIAMLEEEGLDNVFARHARLAEATRRAVAAWGLEQQSAVPAEASNAVTAVRMPEGHDADAFRKLVLDRFDTSLGSGLGKVAGKVFRIGHLGDLNEPMLLGALTSVEMGLKLAGVPHRRGGVDAAMDWLTGNS